MTERDRIVALAAAACLLLFWLASIRLGLLPCNHGCYWCGTPLKPAPCRTLRGQ